MTYYFQSETPTQPYRIHRHLSELYTFVYENCTSKPNYEEKMFETYKSALLRHLIKYMEILNEGLRQEKVIHTYNLIWDSYKVYLRLLANRVFLYLVTICLFRAGTTCLPMTTSHSLKLASMFSPRPSWPTLTSRCLSTPSSGNSTK